jgi:hypothetical protein
MADAQNQAPEFNNPILGRFFLSKEEKESKEKGKAILKAVYSQQTSNSTNLNFFAGRNARWTMLLLWAKGSQDNKEFLDYMNVVDGNKAYVNIDMTQSRLAPQFVGTLIESMSKNKTYACVKAVDDGSVNEKEQRMDEALFRMREVGTIADVQQQTGMQVEPTNAYVPDDEISARVYFELEDRLPKEIRFEKMVAKVQDDIHFDKIINRKTLYDLTVLNSGVTKIDKIAPREYVARRCVPTNMVYNFFMNDNGECEITQIGEFYSLKVKDFRARFGKTEERPNGLTEQEIFNLAKLSTNKNVGTYSNVGMFNYMWQDNWSNTSLNMNRPYDDNSILVFDCEIAFEDEDYYVSKKDAFGKEDIQAKKNVPYQQKTKDGRIIEQSKPEGTEIIKKKKNTWMRGVYAPYGDVMLYWGRPDIIITPYTDVAKALSSYTINIPNNDGEYVPSLFERIIEPLREYQLTKLKRKQLIAKIKPSGIRIDIESARNLQLGTGDTIAWEEVMRIYDQTGNEIFSSKGVDPLQPQAPPLSNTVRNDTINDIIGLTNILSGIVLEIRQLIGVPQYRDGSDVGDRTSGVLQEQQNASSYNVTDFVLNANNQLWEETFYKICLLHWNDIVKEEPETSDDMINTRFSVSVKMKASEYQKQLLEKDIQMYSQMPDAQGNPSLSLKDAMMIREIDDYKLARWYLVTSFEQNRRKAIEDSQKLQEQNAQVQQQSSAQAAQQQQQLETEAREAAKEMEEFKATKTKEIELLKGFLAASAKDETGQLIKMFLPAIQQLVPNITIPLSEENKQMQEQLAMQAQQQQQQEQGEMEQPMQQNPQEEMQEQPMQ